MLTMQPPYLAPALLMWRPHLHPVLGGLLILALAIWMVALHGRMSARLSPQKASLLLLPKAMALLLLLMAIFDPTWSTVSPRKTAGKLLVLLDASSSMDVADDARLSRSARSQAFLDRLKQRLGRAYDVSTLPFDTALREAQAPELPADPAAARRPAPPSGVELEARGTDLGSCLLQAAERPDISAFERVILLTDGGDEALPNVVVPPVPLDIVGFGRQPMLGNDLAIARIQCPASVELDVGFAVEVDVAVHASNPDFAAALSQTRIALERQTGDTWQPVAEQTVDLTRRRARVTFETVCSEVGVQTFRVLAPKQPGELSFLNNSRLFDVEVSRRSLHVLYFTRALGSSLKMIRAELGADPGITFTALFRTIGERFTVQGRRLPGDEALEAGFPASQEVLKLFDCIILGSFPFTEWTMEQAAALLEYVKGGGAVVFLGGDESFASGGYQATPLEALFPWVLTGAEADMDRGRFPVSIPAASADHPIMAGIATLLREEGQPVIESINPTGRLKPGATSLMNVGSGNRVFTLIAVHPFGKGRVLAVATNTLWKWAREQAGLRSAYGLFWRQAVRNLAQSLEGGRLLSVKWDRESYRPGEQATVEIGVVGEQAPRDLKLAANYTLGENVVPLPVEPWEGRPNTFTVRMTFKQRGTYAFNLAVYREGRPLEEYSKHIPVAPMLSEGMSLELDEAFLQRLAAKSGGRYEHEDKADSLLDELDRARLRKTVVSESSLIYGSPYFMLLFLLTLAGEWTLRRMLNLF